MMNIAYFYKIFFCFTKSFFPVFTVYLFFAIFLLQPPVMFLTHLEKSVICSFTKRCYKIVIKKNSSAKKFLEVAKGIERVQQNALDKLRFFRSRLRVSLVIVFFTKIEDHNYVF